MMFERFGQRSRRAIVLAQFQARDLAHNYLGTEHLLLALLTEDLGIASRVLAQADLTPTSFKREVIAEIGRGSAGLEDKDVEALAAIGIDYEEGRWWMEEIFGPFPPSHASECKRGTRLGLPFTPKSTHPLQEGVDLPLTPKSKRALQESLRQACALGHNYVAPEHLLLSLLDDTESMAVKLIRRLGTRPDTLRERTLVALRDGS
jgi:ATP-dependent Clp protease ATP-binding subunit ClpA